LGRGKYEFYAQLPDHTGNVGQFSMANEPSLHIPYLYNYAGQPWKTQKRIRQMLKTWFRNDLMGMPGDEDGGGMKRFDLGLGLKFGVEFCKKFQVAFGYDWGLIDNADHIDNKNRNMMISLSYMF